jgi:hypothetical protein
MLDQLIHDIQHHPPSRGNLPFPTSCGGRSTQESASHRTLSAQRIASLLHALEHGNPAQRGVQLFVNSREMSECVKLRITEIALIVLQY